MFHIIQVKMRLPQDTGNIWTQFKNSIGILWASFNINLTELQGKLRIATRFMINTSSDTGLTGANGDADLNVPIAFVKDPNQNIWYSLGQTTGYVFKGTAVPNGAFTQDSATGTPTNSISNGDLVVFNALVIAITGNIDRLSTDGTTWTSVVSSTAYKGPSVVFGNRLYFVGTNIFQVFSMNTSYTVVTSSTNTISLESYNSRLITCMKATKDNIYIGTIGEIDGVPGTVYQWNGVSSSVITPLPIPALGVVAMTIKDGVPWVLDTNAVLRRLNGTNWEPMAKLPLKKGKYLKSPYAAGVNRYIHYNGIFTRGEEIYMLINGQYSDADGINEENIPSGVYCYSEENGIHFVGSLSQWVNGTTATATDFGASKISKVGALVDAQTTDTTSTTNGDMLAGAEYYKDATNTKIGIFLNDRNDTKQKAGYIVTNKIFSTNITDIWQRVYVRFRRFLNSGDTLTIKGRNTEDDPVEATITWTSTTTCTTTTNVSAYDPDTLGYQPELEVLTGIGSGRCPHITDISESGGTYTITVDETVTSASGTAKARFQKWFKIGSYNAQTDEMYKPPIDSRVLCASSWLQLKVYLLATGRDEIHDITISNKVNEKIE